MRRSSTPHESTESVEITARHMADAIGFLMRVAVEAGLRGIALELAGVRANLLTAGLRNLAANKGDDNADSMPEALTSDEDSDERSKPH